MVILIIMLLAAAINGLLLMADGWMNSLWDVAFNVSSQIPAGWFSLFLSNLQNTMFYIAVSLLVVKFLKKIFDIYVLWVDGDPDTEPIQLLVNFARALITAICFKFFWDLFVKVGDEILDQALSAITGPSGSLQSQWANANWGSLGLMPTIFGLIFLVFMLILYIKFLRRGLEVALMICGAPLACIGLMDNDHGFFKPYVTQLTKLILTTIFQIICIRLGVSLALSSGLANGFTSLLWGIGAMVLAMSIPNILSEFLLPQPHNASISQKLYSVSMLSSVVRRAVV